MHAAIVRGFDLSDAAAACPACNLSDLEWARVDTRIGCHPRSTLSQGPEATRSSPVLCSAAAHLAAAEACKWLERRSEHALRGEEVMYCMQSHRVFRTRLPASSQCRCPHRRWQCLDIGQHPARISLEQALANLGQDVDRLQVRGEKPWCSFTICSACGSQVLIRRFAAYGTTLGSCSCGQNLEPVPVGMRSVLPQDDVWACRDKPLSALGLQPGSALGAGRGGDWTYFFLPGALAPTPMEDAS
jgi:hypothetical protein